MFLVWDIIRTVFLKSYEKYLKSIVKVHLYHLPNFQNNRVFSKLLSGHRPWITLCIDRNYLKKLKKYWKWKYSLLEDISHSVIGKFRVYITMHKSLRRCCCPLLQSINNLWLGVSLAFLKVKATLWVILRNLSTILNWWEHHFHLSDSRSYVNYKVNP